MLSEIKLTAFSKAELQEIINQALASNHVTVPGKEHEKAKELPQLLSISDMCRFFKVSRVTIHDWMKKGKFTYYKISRRVYFKLDEVLHSMKSFDLTSVQTFNDSYLKKEQQNG